ncbi:MAG: hypothetical protein IKL11_04805 [Muribaculaceae bacterium]|nr:hypothetical protein [Muribaculaceae bacterium]
MDSKKYYHQILPLAIFATIVALCWIYWTVGRTIFTLMGDASVLNDEHYKLRWSIVIGYSVLALALIAIQTIFFVKQLRSLKQGVMFKPGCWKLILWWGIVWVFYDFCATNLPEMIYTKELTQIVVDGTMVGVPVIAFVFSFLYRVATDVAEENNLTI